MTRVRLNGVRWGVHEHGEGRTDSRVVLELSGEPAYRTFTLENPDRLVVDLQNTTFGLRQRQFTPDDELVRQVRAGQYSPWVTRVVLDLERPAGYTAVFLEADPQARPPQPCRLVIDLEREAARKDKQDKWPWEADLDEVKDQEEAAADAGPGQVSGEADGPAANSPLKSVYSEYSPVETDTQEGHDGHGTSKDEPPKDVPTAAGHGTADHHKGDAVHEQAGADYGKDSPLPLAGRRICLDAGHGGKDTGAIGAGGLQEKKVTLSVVLALGELLQQQGAEILYTRKRDHFVSLQRRVETANKAKADIFLSVHSNFFQNATAHGLETYCYQGVRQANYLALALQKQLVRELGWTDRGVKQAGYYVLRFAEMPAVLTEVGFISNPDEAYALGLEGTRQRVAEALCRGIIAYFAQKFPG